MKVLTMKQGSPEWFAARRGIPTASQFSRIVTPKTLKLSSQADGYMCELLAERFLPPPPDSEPVTGWMTRGTELEPLAIRWYEFDQDCEVEVVGFVLSNDGRVGCSPDGLVGTKGLIEIKAPKATNHIANMLGSGGIDPAYRLQVQGNIWLCERDWADEISFNPALPSSLKRQNRDQSVIGPLDDAVRQFCDRLDRAAEKMILLGCSPETTIPQEVLA